MKFIMSGLVAVFVVGALYSAIPSSAYPHHFQGILSDTEPKFDIKDLVNLSDKDFKVLTAFQGYAKYLAPKYGKFVYLALAPVSNISLLDEGPLHKVISFESTNATLAITFGRTKPLRGKNQFKNISIVTKDGDAEKSCEVKDPEIIFRGEFECEKPITLSCVRGNNEVAQLVIVDIRAELSGDTADHRRGKYSYQVDECQ